MREYALAPNVIVFLVAFWTAVFYALITRDWFGTVLWFALGVAGLVSERLTPPRHEDEGEL